MPTLEDSIAAGHLDPAAAAYLRAAVAARKRILICGGPSSGATSRFHALLFSCSGYSRGSPPP